MPAAKSNKSSKEDKAPKDSNQRDLQAEIEKTAKLFDVAKPGETPAPATSRPVIVGHNSMIKDDPMMKDKNAGNDTPEEEKVVAKTFRAKTLKPLGDTDEKASEIEAPAGDEAGEKISVSVKTKRADKPTVETEKPAEEVTPDASPVVEEEEAEIVPAATEVKEEAVADTPPENTPVEEPVVEDQPEQTEPSAEEADDTAPGQGVVDSLVEEANAKKENQKKEDEHIARAEEAEKLIASKEFFVPIGQVSRRRSNHRIILGVLVLVVLAAAAVNFAVDAEAIDIGVNAFTDLL